MGVSTLRGLNIRFRELVVSVYPGIGIAQRKCPIAWLVFEFNFETAISGCERLPAVGHCPWVGLLSTLLHIEQDSGFLVPISGLERF